MADRTRLLDAMGPVGQLARSIAPRQPHVAAELGRIRAVLRSQLVDVFGARAGAGAGGSSTTRSLAALDVACSWEARHLLRQDQRLSQAGAPPAIALTIRRLLAGVR